MRQIISPLDGFRSPFGRLMGSTAPFTPAVLFGASEPGVWYDPSDLTTLFQDTAGTLPVTTPGQTVALALDKSKGLVLGGELVNNANWSAVSSATVSVSGTTVTVTDPGGVPNFQAAILDVTTVAGKWYEFSGFVVSTTDPRNVVTLNIWNGAFSSILYTRANIPVVSNVSAKFQAIGSTTRLHLVEVDPTNTTAKNWVWRDISVKELPGFHATQATLASRPTYGIVPLGGRRNLLTWSEEVDNAAWTKSNITVSANAGVAPNGTTTADKLVPNATTANFVILQSPTITLSPVTQTIYAKAAGWSYVNMTFDGARFSGSQYVTFNLSGSGSVSGSNIATGSIQAVGDGWYRCIATATPASAGAATVRYMPANSNVGFFPTLTGNGTDGILIWGAQLETGSSATAYQRVGSAFDVTEAGVASLSYLSFDGVDDFMVTPTITPGTDKAQVFAGVRKLSDANIGVPIEFTVDASSNNGSFVLYSSVSSAANWGFGLRGSTWGFGTASPFAAPITNVLTALYDIGAASDADEVKGRVNGNAQTLAFSADPGGTGNFANAALYIGRRGAAGLAFNGQIYSMIVRFGTNLDAGTITSTETWVGGKTGIDIAKIISPTIFARDETAILDRFNATIERRAV